MQSNIFYWSTYACRMLDEARTARIQHRRSNTQCELLHVTLHVIGILLYFVLSIDTQRCILGYRMESRKSIRVLSVSSEAQQPTVIKILVPKQCLSWFRNMIDRIRSLPVSASHPIRDVDFSGQPFPHPSMSTRYSCITWEHRLGTRICCDMAAMFLAGIRPDAFRSRYDE